MILLLGAHNGVKGGTVGGCTLQPQLHFWCRRALGGAARRHTGEGDDVVAPLAALRSGNSTCVRVEWHGDMIMVRNTGPNIVIGAQLRGHASKGGSALGWVAFSANHFSLRSMAGERAVGLLPLGNHENVTSVSVSARKQQC